MFASGSMQGGGAERVVSVLANHFSSIGLQASILVVRGASVYPLADHVVLRALYEESEFSGTLFNKIWRRLIYIPRLLRFLMRERPDVVIPVHGGGWNGHFVFLCWLLGIKVIAAEHISWTVGRRSLKRWFERIVVYRLADALAVLTEDDHKFYSAYLPHVVRIPNPLPFALLDESVSRANTILAAGNLDRWQGKGFDTLLDVFSGLFLSSSNWRLLVVGSGDIGKPYLEGVAREFGVLDRVDFPGFRSDVIELFQASKIFVLSSRFEGFGMVLLEAMSQGCACISFDCPSGPADIIEHGVDGLLIPDQDKQALAAGLQRLMNDEALRESLGRAAVAKASRYRVEVIGESWRRLFESIGVRACS